MLAVIVDSKEKCMITDYNVVTATRLADLQDRVRQQIGSGWQPIGGIALVHEDDAGNNKPHMVFAQAMVSQNAG